jgi:hypothetical protein
MKQNNSEPRFNNALNRQARDKVASRVNATVKGSKTNPVFGVESFPRTMAGPVAFDTRITAQETIGSSCSEAGERVTSETCSSPLPLSDCSELLHELSNTMTAVLMNAQVLGWKLPPYSHLKRPLRELERAAQRGGELLKRLRRRLEAEPGAGEAATAISESKVSAPVPSVVTLRGRGDTTARTARLSSSRRTSPSPDFLPRTLDLTGQCDLCTSSLFPKGDDGKER